MLLTASLGCTASAAIFSQRDSFSEVSDRVASQWLRAPPERTKPPAVLLTSSEFWSPSSTSPADLSQMWDAPTLASFSLSQLDAFDRIISGFCPWLSRAVQCSGKSRKRFRDPKSLLEAYLDEEASLSRKHTLNMMSHIWMNYETLAFGHDTIQPISGAGEDSWGGLGMMLVDSLDTLWLMGFTAEFERGVQWVEQMVLDVDMNVNLFETSIRLLGGLLGAYHLSGREVLLSRAHDLGLRLMQGYLPLMGEGEPLPDQGVLVDLMRQMGFPSAAIQAVGGAVEKKRALPVSDVNLRTGEVQNLAGFVSLAEVFLPVEFKALALFTGDCVFALPHDEILRIVNASADLSRRGLAPIMLKPDGKAFPSADNRLSMGSRGDSFYEYLLKDSLFVGKHRPSLSKHFWQSFKTEVMGLMHEVDQHQHEESIAAVPEPALVPGVRRRRQMSRPSREEPVDVAPTVGGASKLLRKVAEKRPDASKHRRGGGGARGGWYESSKDLRSPWLFLREVTFTQTVPKMDHLICFLPGALALDVLQNGFDGEAGRRVSANLSLLDTSYTQELLIAHKLMQTCAHMYFRTVSDLAPEITRFSVGLDDDEGSMHNILRPETVESLFLMWRATRSQLYRNWAQRLLSAFSRMRTAHGYASLHNVNRPHDQRDEMPTFFIAETVKYLFLTFSDDEALSLDTSLLSTEAHVLPAGDPRWSCGPEHPGGDGSASEPSVESVQTAQGDEISEPPGDTVLGDAPGPMSETSPVDSRKCVVAANDSMDSLTEALSNCQEQLRRAEQQLDERCEPLREVPSEAPSLSHGDPQCWTDQFTSAMCCSPPPSGNPGCWDALFTFERCCLSVPK